MEVKCPKCSNPFDNYSKWGVKQYCSRKCSNSRTWTDEINLKRSITLSKDKDLASVLYFKNCLFCKNRFKLSPSKKDISKFCSLDCKKKYNAEEILKKIKLGLCNDHDKLKLYLKEKYGYLCVLCKNFGMHNNKPLTLQLDHIDGNSDNNKEENLRLLCPNCHTQTDTYGSKNGKVLKTDHRNKRFRKWYKSKRALQSGLNMVE